MPTTIIAPTCKLMVGADAPLFQGFYGHITQIGLIHHSHSNPTTVCSA